jgi:hypothetical protein
MVLSFDGSNMKYYRVILIPAIKAPQPSTQTEADVSWFKTLSAESVPSASTFLFEHGIVADEDFTWFDLFDKAADLLDDLLQVIEVDEVRSTRSPVSSPSGLHETVERLPHSNNSTQYLWIDAKMGIPFLFGLVICFVLIGAGPLLSPPAASTFSEDIIKSCVHCIFRDPPFNIQRRSGMVVFIFDAEKCWSS